MFPVKEEYDQQGEEKIYTVENVLRKRIVKKKVYYLIKWKGYSSKQNTWEPSENVENLDLIKFFEAARVKAQNESSSNKKSMKRSYYDAIGEIWEIEQVVRKRIKKGKLNIFSNGKMLMNVTTHGNLEEGFLTLQP